MEHPVAPEVVADANLLAGLHPDGAEREVGRDDDDELHAAVVHGVRGHHLAHGRAHADLHPRERRGVC